jgi:hypothetical protein
LQIETTEVLPAQIGVVEVCAAVKACWVAARDLREYFQIVVIAFDDGTQRFAVHG